MISFTLSVFFPPNSLTFSRSPFIQSYIDACFLLRQPSAFFFCSYVYYREFYFHSRRFQEITSTKTNTVSENGKFYLFYATEKKKNAHKFVYSETAWKLNSTWSPPLVFIRWCCVMMICHLNTKWSGKRLPASWNWHRKFYELGKRNQRKKRQMHSNYFSFIKGWCKHSTEMK